MERGETLEPRVRPLTEADCARLRDLAGELLAYRHTVRRGTWIALAAVVLALWVVTLTASDAPAVWVTLFWLSIGAVLAVWLGRDLKSQTAHVRSLATSVEGALERGEAASYDIVARAYVEFEETEDEGACWAFDLGDGRVVFVTGQEYYREDRFPSHDFSIVELLDGRGSPVHEWIEKRGEAVPPARVIPSEVKWEVADGLPGHLGVVRAELERLEEVLAERA